MVYYSQHVYTANLPHSKSLRAIGHNLNILDLVLVANALGKEAPDLNGDGVVNILDLVVVANAFE
ncbi:MAG: hypothetical protein OXH00_14035 [Candidatus Poribacteria bacterium]|nr:hypothetical protein [Candidatus Poribacteria bacterium]